MIEWGVSGLPGMLLAALMTVPLAAFFGFLIGKLLNKMNRNSSWYRPLAK